ncbi:MAG: hypothetical protein IPO15_04970 [Anaerolineae bacterium]|nr:hypothetical protein [Anaerolineae bacterium]
MQGRRSFDKCCFSKFYLAQVGRIPDAAALLSLRQGVSSRAYKHATGAG